MFLCFLTSAICLRDLWSWHLQMPFQMNKSRELCGVLDHLLVLTLNVAERCDRGQDPLPHRSSGSATPSEETMGALCSLMLSLLICNTGMLKATLQLLRDLEIVHVKTLAQRLEHKGT